MKDNKFVKTAHTQQLKRIAKLVSEDRWELAEKVLTGIITKAEAEAVLRQDVPASKTITPEQLRKMAG